MLRILGRETSINVRKVLWLADEIALPYVREDWGKPTRDPQSPEFLALNPNGQVPVIIEDGGFVLWESSAVMRYLCDRHDGSGVWPQDVQQRAIVDQWLTWQATELNPPWGYAVYALLRNEPGFDDEAKIGESLRKWERVMRILDDRLAETGAYVAGPQFSLADIAVGLSVRRWLAIPRTLPELSAVSGYFKQLMARPAATRYLSPPFF